MLKPFLSKSAAVRLGIALSVGIVLAPVAAFAAGPAPQDAPSTNPVKPTAASQEKAKKLYSQDCSVCHGDSGDGKTDLAKDMQLTLGDWTDPKTLASMSDQQLFDLIRKGKDKMPPEDASRAKNDEIWNLIIYIRAMPKSQPAAAPASAPAAPAAPATPAPSSR